MVPAFSRKKYINAFRHFRKEQFDKSALSFKKTPQLNPPYSVIDNILFGLGLSYVKNMLEKHDASIQVISNKNKGSVFLIKFKIDNGK